MLSHLVYPSLAVGAPNDQGDPIAPSLRCYDNERHLFVGQNLTNPPPAPRSMDQYHAGDDLGEGEGDHPTP